MNLYTIRDLTAQYNMQPFVARNHGEAIRSFQNAVNDHRDPNNLMAKHPADFGLYYIGIFDESTGQLQPADVEKLGLGSDFVQQQQ